MIRVFVYTFIALFITSLSTFAQSTPPPGFVLDPNGPYFHEVEEILLSDVASSSDLLVRDMDENGQPEVFVCSREEDVITLLKDFDVSDPFAKKELINLFRPDRISASDIDSDGLMDLIVSTRFRDEGSGQSVNILFQLEPSLGSGTFGRYEAFRAGSTGNFPPYFAQGDVDNDGDIDLLFNRMDYQQNVITLLLNDGNGQFEPSPATFNNFNSSKMLLHDINQDGNLDLALYSSLISQEKGVYIYQGDGEGDFEFQSNILLPAPAHIAFLPGPDGSLPIMVVHDSPTATLGAVEANSRLLLYHQESPFQFTKQDERPIGTYSFTMKVIDSVVGADAGVWVSTKDTTNHMAVQLFKIKDGMFTTDYPRSVFTSLIPNRIEWSDVNGDDLKDIIVLETSWFSGMGNHIGVLLQEKRIATFTPTQPPTPTLSPTPTATNTSTPTLPPSNTPTMQPTNKYTPTLTATFTPTLIPTFTPTPSDTPTPTAMPITPTVTPTITQTPASTPTPAPSLSPTATLTNTPTIEPSPTPTPTLSVGGMTYQTLDLSDVSSSVHDAVFGDLNRDGVDELYLVSEEEETIWMMGMENGSKTIQSHLNIEGHPYALLPIVQDSTSYLIVSLRDEFLLSKVTHEEGQLYPGTQMDLFDDVRKIYSTDYTADGYMDLVVLGEFDRGLIIFPGMENGEFGEGVSLSIGGNVRDIAMYDLEKDGRGEVLILNENSNYISLYHILPGGILFPISSKKVGANPHAVNIGWIDDDEYEDIVVVNNDDAAFTLYTSQGNYGLNQRQTITTQANPFYITIGDFDRDGFDDVLILSEDNTNLAIHYASALGQPVLYETVSQPRKSNVGDINGDGYPDIVVLNQDGSESLLYLSQPGVPVDDWMMY